MLNIVVVENRRRGEGAMERAAAVVETLTNKGLLGEEIKVELLNSITAVKNKMKLETVHAAIFLTKSLELTLKKLAHNNLTTKIFVFADRIPEKKVIWVEREWLSPELFRGLIDTIKS